MYRESLRSVMLHVQIEPIPCGSRILFLTTLSVGCVTMDSSLIVCPFSSRTEQTDVRNHKSWRAARLLLPYDTAATELHLTADWSL